ncbi:MAG: HAMP domain-containing sensor histidine kinase [Acidobacteriota bacterium]
MELTTDNRQPTTGMGTLPAAAELIERIGWIIRLRWLAAAGVALTIELARRIFPVQLPLAQIYALIACLALYNAALCLVARRLRRKQAGRILHHAIGMVRILMPRALWGLEHEAEASQAAVFANAQISLDLVALAVLLHFSGGIENPFIYFFVFHVIIAGILLSRRATYFQATLGLACISLVALAECFGFLAHYPLNGIWRTDAYGDPVLVIAQLLVLGTTLYVSVYMAGNIAAHMRNREREVFVLSKEVSQKTAMLEHAYEKLAAIEKAKSQYMRKVSHELRGPLGTIQTSLMVVLQNLAGEIPRQSQDLLQRAQRKAGDLAQMTSDLLALSRAREVALAVEMEPVRLGELVAGIVEEMRPAADQGGVQLSAEIAPDLTVTLADKASLRQMVDNLLGNAVRYTPRGGRVTLRLDSSGGLLRLGVEDTGIGIPRDDLPRVFDDFFRSSNAREHTQAGTGLGLAIVKAVAEQHGGTVSVESELGQGTRFTVEWPLKRGSGREESGEGARSQDA